ncbi:MAG: sigma factor-like helix-turn-helix DNA-binding protein [Mycobacterium sp.]
MKPAAPGPDEPNSALRRTLVGYAIGQLSSQHRAVLRRSYYQGWTTAQIAADLRIGEANAKSTLHYALRDLQQTPRQTRVTCHGIGSIKSTRKD